MIAEPINEREYRIAGSVVAFVTAGEYGPLDCGCCVVAEAFDPCGPCFCFLMQRRDATCVHVGLGDFESVLP